MDQLPNLLWTSQARLSKETLACLSASLAQPRGRLSQHLGESLQCQITEPVGGSMPKFSSNLKTSGIELPSALPFSLSCPAQGSPVPSYRSVKHRPPQSLLAAQLPSSLSSLGAPWCKGPQPSPLVFPVQLKGLLCLLIGE